MFQALHLDSSEAQFRVLQIKCRVPKGSILGPLLFLPSAMVYFLIIFVICSLLQARYIRIIQEILAFFICLIVELIFENSQFGFKGPKFFNSPSRKIQNSGSISLCSKKLKKFFLS